MVDGRVGGGAGAGVDVFAIWTGEDFVSGGVERFDEDGQRLAEEDAVGDDLGLQAGGLEAGSDVLGGGVVLRRTGPVGRGGERLEVLAGECGVRDGEEGGVPLCLLREVLKAEDLGRDRGGGRCGCGVRQRGLRAWLQRLSRQQQKRCERKQGCERTRSNENARASRETADGDR